MEGRGGMGWRGDGREGYGKGEKGKGGRDKGFVLEMRFFVGRRAGLLLVWISFGDWIVGFVRRGMGMG